MQIHEKKLISTLKYCTVHIYLYTYMYTYMYSTNQ